MKIQTLCRTVVLVGGMALLTFSLPSQADELPADGNCANDDGALDNASFVIATAPEAGERVVSGFAVAGCSRTFESNVQWRLTARDGSEVASGFTHGGGVDGPGPFAFTIAYDIAERTLAHLEVFEEDVSDGEGPPPGRTVLPLVLLP